MLTEGSLNMILLVDRLKSLGDTIKLVIGGLFVS